MDTSLRSTTPDRLPDWLAEALDVLSARRRLVVATAVGLVLFGAIVALVAPSILPPRALVGAAVGVAAALLSTALALALDASDLVVRGARHVRAAGGTVDVRVGRQHDDVGPLLAAVARHAGTGPLRVALAPASRSAGVPGARAAALAEALARTGRKVLLTDLTRGGSPAAGLSDVITGTRTLSEVVRFEQELFLARLAVGSDPDVAIRGFAGWVEGLPSDLEVLVAALPPLAEPGVLAASASLDATLVLVEVDRTERVDLIASLDAVDAANLTCEVVLVDPERTAALASSPADDVEPDEVDHDQRANDDQQPEDDQPAEDVDEPVIEPVPEPILESDLRADAADERADADLAQPDPVPDPAPATEDPFARPAVDEPTVEAPDAPPLVPGAGVPAQAAGSTADATAEIVMPGSRWPATPDDDPGPDDEPVQDDESEQDDSPAAEDELAGIWDDDATERPPAQPDQPWVAPRVDTSSSAEAPKDAPASAVAPAPTAPEPTPEPRPEPTGERRPDPSAEDPLDDAALQAARTSAALQQLAQQIWERDER